MIAQSPGTPETETDMVWRMPKRIREGRQFHVKRGEPYWKENNPNAPEYAAERGYDSIDLDGLWTRPDPDCPYHAKGATCYGHLANTHYPKPLLWGYSDPKHLLPPNKDVWDMTAPEVFRLVAPDGTRIQPMGRQLRRCARHKLVASVDAKSKRGWTPRNTKRLMAVAVRARCATIVKSAWTYPLVSARTAGFQTRYTKDHKVGM